MYTCTICFVSFLIWQVPEGEGAVLTAILAWAEAAPQPPTTPAPALPQQQQVAPAAVADAPVAAVAAAAPAPDAAAAPAAAGQAPAAGAQQADVAATAATASHSMQEAVGRLAAGCVRGGLLSLEQLDVLDRHPQVRSAEVGGWR